MFFDRFISEVSLKAEIPNCSYLKNVPIVRHLENGPITFDKSVSFIVGENGSGKSTLIEAIATAFGFNPEGGSLNFSFETKATHSQLFEYLRLVKCFRPKDGFFLRAESFYNAISYIEELDEIKTPAPKIVESYGGVSLHRMSHGEGFLKLVQNRFSGHGLYILDEPEAALSPTRIMTLICEIDRLVGEGSQFIIATHSPMLMAFPEAEVILIDGDKVKKVGYRETEHYKIYRRFLECPEKMIRELISHK